MDDLNPAQVELISKEDDATQRAPIPKTKLYIFITAAIANFLSFATGITISWITPVIPQMDGNKSGNPLDHVITSSEIAWVAGLMPLGATLGPLMAGKVADKIGRKKILLLLSLIEIVSYAITAFATNIILFYIARFLAGFALGSVFATLPMFLVEISETHNRGTLGCSMNIFVALGLNFSLLVGPYLTIQMFSLVVLVPLCIFFPLFLILGPETPAFLASTKNDEALEKMLTKLRNDPDQVETELKQFRKTSITQKVRIVDLVKNPKLRRSFIICFVIVTLQQSAGLGAIFSYMPQIFKEAQVNLAPHFCGMIIGSFQVVGTILSTVTVDKAGRKFLLLLSSITMCLTLAAIGTYFDLRMKEYHMDSFSWLPVTSLGIFIVAFGTGLGPVPWVVISELFPAEARSTAASILSFACFTASFVVTVTFPYLVLQLGMEKCFYIFALICLAGALFIYWKLPETKGKSLQEIQHLLNE